MYEIRLPVFRTDSSMYHQANELVLLKKKELMNLCAHEHPQENHCVLEYHQKAN